MSYDNGSPPGEVLTEIGVARPILPGSANPDNHLTARHWGFSASNVLQLSFPFLIFNFIFFIRYERDNLRSGWEWGPDVGHETSEQRYCSLRLLSLDFFDFILEKPATRPRDRCGKEQLVYPFVTGSPGSSRVSAQFSNQ
jgi:hypothetical protein